MSTIKRNIIFRINNFQARLLLPVLACCLLTMIASLYALANINFITAAVWESCQFMISNTNDNIPWFFRAETIHMMVPALILLIVAAILILTLWTYYVSNKILGPYQRIITDLDEMIDQNKEKELYVREGDEMFQEIIIRFNKIIKKAK